MPPAFSLATVVLLMVRCASSLLSESSLLVEFGLSLWASDALLSSGSSVFTVAA